MIYRWISGTSITCATRKCSTPVNASSPLRTAAANWRSSAARSDPALFVELLNAGAVPLVFAAIDTDVLAAGLSQRATNWDQLHPGVAQPDSRSYPKQ